MIWKELVNKAYKEKIYWFKKMGCHSDNRYSKKKKQTKNVCVCVYAIHPRKGNDFTGHFQKSSILVVLFSVSQTEKKHKKWTVDD